MGSRRLLWGTDHPFFPPIDGDVRQEKEEPQWQSVVENLHAIESVVSWGEDEKNGVRGSTAVELFSLKER